jgi:EAL domain-containing protein (putative c-di-GMP-specific phosphodiesterase class I)
VIAEGLETEERVALAAHLGVTLGQGWALGRPAPASTWVAATAPEQAASS